MKFEASVMPVRHDGETEGMTVWCQEQGLRAKILTIIGT
jgi:hypothetical protein